MPRLEILPINLTDHRTIVLRDITKNEIAAPQLVPNQLVTDALSIPLGRLSGEIFLHAVRIEIIDPNNNFQAAKDQLEKGSLILSYNHFEGDIFPWARFVAENFPLTRAAAFVAKKYLDPSRGILSKTLVVAFGAWEKAYGAKVIPLVQTKEKDRYPNADNINFGSIKKALRFLKEPGNVLAIAPEGTRTLTNGLGEAEEGIERLLKRGENTLALPVSIRPSRVEIHGRPIQIFVGKLFSYMDIQREHEVYPDIPIKDLIMVRNALLLPAENHGYYKVLLEKYPLLGKNP